VRKQSAPGRLAVFLPPTAVVCDPACCPACRPFGRRTAGRRRSLPLPDSVLRHIAALTTWARRIVRVPAVFRVNVVIEVIIVVGAQVPHAKQDDDHDKGDDGCQTDQHGLGHRTIHRGV